MEKQKEFFLAGFDGYDADDPRQREIDELLLLYQSLSKKVDLVRITPTKYKVQSRSVYSFLNRMNYYLVIPARYKSKDPW